MQVRKLKITQDYTKTLKTIQIRPRTITKTQDYSYTFYSNENHIRLLISTQEHSKIIKPMKTSQNLSTPLENITSLK